MEPAYPASILDDSTSPIGRDMLQEAGLVHSFFQRESQNWTKDPICRLAGNSWDHWYEGLTTVTTSTTRQTNQTGLFWVAWHVSNERRIEQT